MLMRTAKRPPRAVRTARRIRLTVTAAYNYLPSIRHTGAGGGGAAVDGGWLSVPGGAYCSFSRRGILSSQVSALGAARPPADRLAAACRRAGCVAVVVDARPSGTGGSRERRS